MQEFTAPLNTNYKIECWGAQGGNGYEDLQHGNYTNTVYGGKGGYCLGMITLPYNLFFYIYVGQSGEEVDVIKTFNGGGAGGIYESCRSGGGATDIRLSNGTWDDFNSLKSRIMIAAGGGGSEHYREGSNGGNAGGLSGQDGPYCRCTSCNYYPYIAATGATQISGGEEAIGKWVGNKGTFGIGGDKINEYGGGGGGGYYGGGGGASNSGVVGSGSGGSSFISGYTGCNAISESSTEDNIIHTGQPDHYSGKVFTNAVKIDGGSVMPKPKGGTETGHLGNGYCIISWISPSL